MRLKRRLNGYDPMTRRDFMSGAAKSLLGLSAMPWMAQIAGAGEPAGAIPLGGATARNVIYLYMAGGMSHVDTLDPKPGSAAQGPTQAIASSADGPYMPGTGTSSMRR